MIRLSLLGRVDLVGLDRPGAILTRPKLLAILAYLVVARPRGFHRRDALLALFWPERDDAHARSALRQLLHYLRKALGPGVVVTRGDDDVAIDSARIACDVVAFESLLDQGKLTAALDLYRGHLLPGVHLSGSVELERWLEDERELLRRRAVDGAATLTREHEQRGDAAGAIAWARRWLELSPHDEVGARQLISLLGRTNARSEAIEVYRTFALRLQRDLELDPSSSIELLTDRIRAGQAETAGALVPKHPEFLVVPPDPPARPLPPPPDIPDSAASSASSESRPVRKRTRDIRRVRRQIVAAVLVCATLVVAGLAEARRRTDTVDDMSARTIAVLPFAVTGNIELAYLRDGLADLLSTNLDGAGPLRTVDANAVLEMAASDSATPIDPARAHAIARRTGAGSFILGGVIAAGGRLRAKASLYDSRGRHRGTAEAVVAEERLVFELVDDLARQIVAMSFLSPPEGLTRLGSVTTESFEALKSYLVGEQLQRAGQYDSAVRAYERSVRADTSFALAYYRMAVAQHRDATPTGPADALRRALAFAGRLAPRDRMLLQAFDAFDRHQDLEAERLYREVLSLHPDEIEAWLFLGEVIEYYGLWRGRGIAGARAAFERVRALDSSHVAALTHLVWIAAMEERFEEGALLAERVLALQPDGYAAPAARLLVALSRRDSRAEARSLAEIRFMESGYINHAQRWAHFSGNLGGRKRAARLLVEPSRPARWRRLGHVVSARYEIDHGRWRAAFAELKLVKPLDPDGHMVAWARLHLRPLAPTTSADLARLGRTLEQWNPAAPGDSISRMYLLGLVHARQGDSSAVWRVAGDLEAHAIRLKEADPGSRTAARTRDLAHGLRATQLAEAGRPADALAHLDQLRPEDWWLRGEMGGAGVDALQVWLRAETLAKLGREEEALRLYAPLGWLWGDAGLLAPKHLHMGELYERLGDRQSAARHYRRFLELWATCDPELMPVVAEVTARVRRF